MASRDDDDTWAAFERAAAEASADDTAVDGGDPEHGLARVLDVARRMVASADPTARYEAGPVLGRGGVGEVRLARDALLRREVAVKQIQQGERDDRQDSRRRFLREAQVSGQLEHPNIVPVYDLGVRADGSLFFTMRRIRGRSLAELLERRELGSLVRRLEIFLKVCDAVAYAHSRGVVHRDLKPGNVMIGSFGEVLVLDWGLAKLVSDPDPSVSHDRPVSADDEDELTSAGVVGTPAWMAPEQARGQRVSARTDVYALGALLYALLVGRRPFDGGADLLERVAAGRFPAPRERDRRVARELDAVVREAMATVPSERYRSVEELRADVEAFLEGRELRAYRYSVSARVARWVARRRAVLLPVGATAAVGSVLLVGASIGWGALALRARDRAVAAEHVAQVRLAEGEVALGLALADQGRVDEARERLSEAERSLARLGEPTLGALAAASWVEQRFPRPLLDLQGAYGTAARLAPDGRSLLAVTSDGTAVWRSVPDGRVLARLEHGPISLGALVMFVDDVPVVGWWSPDRLELQRVRDGSLVAELPGPSRRGPYVNFLPSRDGHVLVVASTDQGTHAFSLPDGAPFGAPAPDRWALTTSDSARWVNGTPRTDSQTRQATDGVLWDLASGEVRARYPYDLGGSLADDGRRLIREGDEVVLRDVDGRELWRTATTLGSRQSFVAGDRQIVSLDPNRALWLDAATGAELRRIPTPGAVSQSIGEVQTSADGEVLATVLTGRIQVWSPARLDPGVRLSDEGLNGLALSDDGVLALVAGADGTATLVERATLTVLRRFPWVPEDPTRLGSRDVTFTRDQLHALVADRDGGVRRLDLVDGTWARFELPAYPGQTPLATAVWSLSDGGFLAAYASGAVTEWSSDGRIRRQFVTGLESVWSLVGVDERRVVATGRGSEDAPFVVLDLASGDVTAAPGRITAYRASAAGDTLAVAVHSGDLQLWTLGPEGPVERGRLVAGRDVVIGTAFGPGGQWLVSGAYDGRLTLWEVATGAERLSMQAHQGPIADVAFSPDGEALLSVGADGRLVEIDLTRARSLDRLLPAFPMAEEVPDPSVRPRDLARVSMLRRDWPRAAALMEDAAAVGVPLGPLEIARVQQALGRRDAAHEALREALRTGAVRESTARIWLAAP